MPHVTWVIIISYLQTNIDVITNTNVSIIYIKRHGVRKKKYGLKINLRVEIFKISYQII